MDACGDFATGSGDTYLWEYCRQCFAQEDCCTFLSSCPCVLLLDHDYYFGKKYLLSSFKGMEQRERNCSNVLKEDSAPLDLKRYICKPNLLWYLHSQVVRWHNLARQRHERAHKRTAHQPSKCGYCGNGISEELGRGTTVEIVAPPLYPRNPQGERKERSHEQRETVCF